MNTARKLAANLQTGEAALVASPHNRRYLTGFASSDGYVLITREADYFLTDSRYIEAARRHIREMECLCYRRPMAALQELLESHGVKKLHVSGGNTTLSAFHAMREAFRGCEVSGGKELDNWLGALRRVKSPEELAKIRQAQALTEAGFDHILPFIRTGRTEREIALELEFFIRRQGAECVAFDFIVVSGANSSLPHGVPGDKKVEPGDFVTMDFGAVVDGWHSDMTRTVAVGTVSEEQKRVYDTVLAAQLAALSVLKAGLDCAAGDAAARRVIEQAGYGENFGHSTGHGVGVEIHEEPRLSPSANGCQLEPGNVVTVEPGIYLEGKFGVRIEDMAFITDSGCENLTKSPKSLLIL